ncbi:hypothetical protein DFH07DRAFT_785572 [Mycena maculata]|uniref:Uncharacterized protein n=1 Tax=Mycena maculata TaxID=230809 RepID=A0AAD7MG26_9AGAR|nr:hypothetical protein DFH07DRAFT_785572 [Mycena maculata]
MVNHRLRLTFILINQTILSQCPIDISQLPRSTILYNNPTAWSTGGCKNIAWSTKPKQLNQYWWYGFGSTEVQRHCSKVQLELPISTHKPSDPIVSGVPTLLNADPVDDTPIDEEALFNHPDPYGIKDYEAMQEGEDDSDTTSSPLCFAPDQEKPQQPVAEAAKNPLKDLKAKWDAEWDAEQW